MGIGIYYGVPYKKSIPESSDKSFDNKKYGDSTTEYDLEQQENSVIQTTLKLTSS